jgi:hypothetical protein
MKALISREDEHGRIAEVGGMNQIFVSGYKTIRGIIKSAKRYANGKRFKIEFFRDSDVYGEPFKIYFS